MKISIIIPTLNEENFLPKLLESIKTQTFKPFEVIVIDAGSTDKTVEIAKKYNTKVINSSPPVGNQRNIAGQNAKGELLIYLDADTLLDKNFIKRIKTKFKKNQIDIACPIYSPETKKLSIKLFFTFLNSIFFLTQGFLPSGAGMCIIVRKSFFDECGGFDKSAKFDDILFIRKAAKKGKFKFVLNKVYASDRRFLKYGIYKTMATYLVLSGFFSFNLIKQANLVSYEFGKYNE